MRLRDPLRIPKILALLDEYWHLYPDMRLGQILENAASELKRPTYHMEDDELIQLMEGKLAADPPTHS
jgi:uncharacterized protein YihD (DUF1040 family)